MEENKSTFSSQPTNLDAKPTSYKKYSLFIAFGILILLVGIFSFLLSQKNTSQPSPTPPLLSPTVTSTQSPLPSQITSTSQKTWQVYSPANHTFISPDKSFSFVYPTGWTYETIDGLIPRQQHIVYLGRQRSTAERQALAQRAGIPLRDTLDGISYTSQEISLYYTNTSEFQVKKLEDLATGEIISKKQITVDNVPALEVIVNCPTECKEILFTKGLATFVFVQARSRDSSEPLDEAKLKQIISTFTFLK